MLESHMGSIAMSWGLSGAVDGVAGPWGACCSSSATGVTRVGLEVASVADSTHCSSRRAFLVCGAVSALGVAMGTCGSRWVSGGVVHSILQVQQSSRQIGRKCSQSMSVPSMRADAGSMRVSCGGMGRRSQVSACACWRAFPGPSTGKLWGRAVIRGCVAAWR